MYFALSPPTKPLRLFCGAVLIARFPKKRHGAPAVWLGAKGTYPICPILRRGYLAPLSLSRFIRHFRENAGKGVSRFQPGADIVNPISC